MLSPRDAHVLCAYASDGETDDRRCQSVACVPGCNEKGVDGLAHWCTVGEAPDSECAWRPEHLEQMLSEPSSRRSTPYNEVVIASSVLMELLPSSIEAFYFDPALGPGRRVRDAWQRFLERYADDELASRTPLLRLEAHGDDEMLFSEAGSDR